jgi:conjugative transfer signal peptidase TraF
LIRAGQSDRLRRVTAVLTAISLPVAFAFAAAGGFGLRFNASPSLPIGIYIVTKEASNLAEFCPAEPFGRFAAARGYRSAGSCPDGAAPLLKPVVAQCGDRVEFTNRGIAVNGKLLLNTAPRQADTDQRQLKHWPFGTYVVAQNSIWVASAYNARSYDSRYFGPIRSSVIRNHLRPLIVLR